MQESTAEINAAYESKTLTAELNVEEEAKVEEAPTADASSAAEEAKEEAPVAESIETMTDKSVEQNKE